MATYITGVTDYIPQIQPWKPDYNLYQNVLERKQSQYDRGWEQTNSIYNGILNAPMLRADNMETRDKFFKDIQTQIKQLSSVDLSLPQNVDTASQIFKPFYEDENIVKDIGFTKKYQDEMAHSEYLRKCTDKTKCGDKFWDGGQKLLQYKVQDFINASAEDALKMQAPTYVPKANFMEKATAALKEAGGLNMEYESSNGRYIIKEKNGGKAVGTLMDFMSARFGDDPELTNYFKAKASLLRYENPDAAIDTYEKIALKSQAKSEEEYKQLVKDREAETNLGKAKATLNTIDEEAKSGLDILISKKQAIENQINNEGILPGSPEDMAYQEILSSEDSKKQSVENITKTAENIKKINYIDSNGKKLSADELDNVIGQAMMFGEMSSTANTLAYKDYSHTMKVDSYGLASFNNQLATQRDYIKHTYKMSEIGIQEIFKAGAEERKQLVANGNISPINGMPYWVDPETQKFPLIEGGGMGTGGAADQAAFLRQQLLSGVDLNTAMTRLNLTREAIQIGQGVTAKKAGNGVIKYTETNKEPNTYIPFNMLGGINQQEDIQVSADTLNIDKAVPLAIEGMAKESGTGIYLATNNFIDRLAGTIETQKASGLSTIGSYDKSVINRLIDVANDPKNKDASSAQLTLLSIGDLLKENTRGKKIDNELLKQFPSSNNNSTYNGDYWKKLSESDISSDILFYAGIENVHSLLNGTKKETISRRVTPESFINPMQEFGKPTISTTEYTNLKAKELGQGPLKRLNDSEKEAIRQYEYITTNPKINNNLQGIKLEDLMGLSFEEMNEIKIAEAQLAGANTSKNNFITHMTQFSKSFGEKYNNEDASYVERILAQNMWNPSQGLGKLNNLDNIYPKVIEATNAMLLAGEYNGKLNTSSTIPDLEKAYLSNGNKIPDNLLNTMLLKSQLIMQYDLPGNLDKNIPNWQTFLTAPTTKIKRNGDKIIMTSPHLKGGKSQEYDISGIKVLNQYDDAFDETYNNAGKIRASFMNEAQDIHGNQAAYLMFPSEFGNQAGNFSSHGSMINNVPLKANVKNQAYYEITPILKEIANQLPSELTEMNFNLPQGDMTALSVIRKALENPDKDPSKNPVFTTSIQKVKGKSISAVTIKIDPAEANKLLKPAALSTYDASQEDPKLKHGYAIPLTNTYYINNSKAPILKRMEPDPMQTLIGLYEGKSYTDESFKDRFGGSITYRRNGDNVDMSITHQYYDENTKTMREYTRKMNSKPLRTTDWKKEFKNNNTILANIKSQVDQSIPEDEKITNTSYYNQDAK